MKLPVIPPYDWTLALRMIGAHSVPGAERTEPAARTHSRLVPGAHGPVQVTIGWLAGTLRATVGSDDEDDRRAVRKTLRAWLDLDHDPTSVGDAFGDDPRLGPLVAARPGLRRIGYPDPFEAVAVTVLGQQVSLAAGRTFAGRLVAAFGERGPGGLRAFPAADRLARQRPRELRSAVGVTGARAETLSRVARLFAEAPPLLPGQTCDADRRDDVARTLLGLPGIGPWTVQYLRMRLLGDPDALPASDLVLRRALGVRRPQEVVAMAEAWRPLRSYAVFHLWASTAW